MDSDLWISRLAAAKRNYQISQSDRFSMEDFEVEEEIRSDFICPYCYEYHDLTSLCPHLEDEHPFESKVAVCPLCSVKVVRDMLSHITLQHGHLIKDPHHFPLTANHLQRRRRLRRVPIPNNSQALSLLGRDLREAHLQVLLGAGYQSSNTTTSTAVTDSLLSSLDLNFPASEVEESSKSTISTVEDVGRKKTRPMQTWKSSVNDPSLSHEERERKRKQDILRAAYVQDLLLSSLFRE